ncbi:MAG TPA: M36 family metallopeptidase [Gaiellaceae bacterium]|nr:M36 family metallopeptidase [Gaiellaceae bacterium]
MRLKVLGAAVSIAALGVILLPGSALPVAQISEDVAEIADFDSRSGKVAPTKLQRAHAKKIKAKVRWGQFGTPASISRQGRFLARGIRGKTAADAARWYINRHKALFGLQSMAGMRLEAVSRLVGSKGYAVNFRQTFGNLAATESGLVTVGVTGSKNRWKVAYVSSSLTRYRSLAGTAKLSAAGAWVSAARSAGLTRTIANVLSRKVARGWTQLGVAGLQGNQLSRLVAFPTLRQGVLPAYETIVVDLNQPLALRAFVDARSGRILARSNLVEHATSGRIKLAANESFSYSGELAATDAACNTHGPFAVGTGNRALDGFSAATVPTNDLVLELWKDGVRLVQADTLFSPEQFHYEPAGGILAGNYEIRVCDFPGGGGWAAPRTYTGTLTADASPPPPAYLARWKVFPNVPQLYTLNQDPWNIPSLDTRETWCWIDAPGCDRLAGGALTSRGSWDHDHKLNAPTFTTRGNNAKSATSWTHNLLPSPPQHMPTSMDRDYSYAWTNDWYNRDCEPTAGAPGATWDDSAATVNLFMAHNRMHDWSYHLGFTERNWNAQDYNFGLTERRQESDPILGDVQAGALIAGVRDNANMITFPDGTASVTNMYFWQPIAGAFYAPCVDGDYDMGVIGHEYGHMIENRMIGKGSARSGHHAGAMGESHGDLFGMEVVNEYGFTPVNDENRYAVGVYDTGNKQRAIRNYGMNFPTSGGVPKPGEQLMINALNFSDMGYDVTGPQVHADGEIWSKTNFVLRQLLVEKYNKRYPVSDQDLQTECAEGYVPAHRCPGNRRWIQLAFDAMLLMPTNPSMLQARDALLAADLMRFGGANQKELWLGYARQGFGVNASSTNTTANTDTDPTPDFEPLGTTPATVKFEVENYHGDDVSARIYVGHYEARVSPIADTNPATTGAINLDDTAKFAPGTYELIAHAPGYGFHRFRETFKSGKDYELDIELPTNWASLTSGATATTTDGAATVNNLIDDTEGTNWAAPATNVGGASSVDGKTATIDLAGTDDVKVRYVQVSAHLSAGQSRFAALRSFELWACNDDKGDDCTDAADYDKVYTSPADAFPASPPRPVAPHLILRKFDVKDFHATHIKFVVKTNQCTGGPAFQGNQDADPANNADCDTNVPVGNARDMVRSTELQVFRSSADIDD